MASPTILQICHLARKTECPGSHITSLCPQHPTMAHTKAEVHVTRTKKLEKRVAKLEKEKEEEKRHIRCWRENILKEQRIIIEKMWGLIKKKRDNDDIEKKRDDDDKATKSWRALKALNKTLTRHMTRP